MTCRIFVKVVGRACVLQTHVHVSRRPSGALMHPFICLATVDGLWMLLPGGSATSSVGIRQQPGQLAPFLEWHANLCVLRCRVGIPQCGSLPQHSYTYGRPLAQHFLCWCLPLLVPALIVCWPIHRDVQLGVEVVRGSMRWQV